MENKIRVVLLTTAAVLTAMLFWSWKHRPPEAVLVRTAAAETQDIYNSVTIFGTVESAESTAVCPAKNGVVSAVYAATGDTVQKGDILCTLTDIGRSQTAADYWQTAQSVFAISGTVNTVTAEDAHALYRPICRAYKLRIRISCACVRSLPSYMQESLLSGSALTSHFRQWTAPFTPD